MIMAIVTLMPLGLAVKRVWGDPQWVVYHPSPAPAPELEVNSRSQIVVGDTFSYLSAVRANMTGMSHMWHGYFGGSFLSFCLSPSCKIFEDYFILIKNNQAN